MHFIKDNKMPLKNLIPGELLKEIYSYDHTYREQYDRVMSDLKMQFIRGMVGHVGYPRYEKSQFVDLPLYVQMALHMQHIIDMS